MHPGPLAPHRGQKAAVQLLGRRFQQADPHLDSGVAQLGDALAVDLFERVLMGHHHAVHAAVDQGLMAGTGASDMAAGFHGHVGGGTPRQATGLAQGEHLGVGPAGPPMPAFADHLRAMGDHATHPRIGPGGVAAPFCQGQGVLHVLEVDFAEVGHGRADWTAARGVIG